MQGKDVGMESLRLLGKVAGLLETWWTTSEKQRCRVILGDDDENVVTAGDVMAVLHMVRGNVWRINHAQGGYEHDSGGVLVTMALPHTGRWIWIECLQRSNGRTNNMWKNGEGYPTHVLVRLAVMMDINRGKQMTRLSSSIIPKHAGLIKYVDHPKGGEFTSKCQKWSSGGWCGRIRKDTMRWMENQIAWLMTHHLQRPPIGFSVQGTEGLAGIMVSVWFWPGDYYWKSYENKNVSGMIRFKTDKWIEGLVISSLSGKNTNRRPRMCRSWGMACP